jgi:hypothetical protein
MNFSFENKVSFRDPNPDPDLQAKISRRDLQAKISRQDSQAKISRRPASKLYLKVQ